MADPVVRLQGVTRRFPAGEGAIEVLRDVDMTLLPGEFVALLGQSGSGKSTLLNIIGALDRPSGGAVVVDGVDLVTAGDDELARLRNRRIGFIFQFHYLLDEFSCLENALLPLCLAGRMPDGAEVARITALLTRVGLGHRLHSRPGKMSGGEQQRTAVIRALANRPRLILADEPTGNLDSRSGQQVFDLMREMNRELGTAFLLVTHDERLARAADRTLHIVDGRLRDREA